MKTHVELQGKVKGDTSHIVHQRIYWNFSDYKRLVIKISIKAISISPDSYCKLKLSRRSVWIIWMINLCCRTHCPTICALPWQSELTPGKMTLTHVLTSSHHSSTDNSFIQLKWLTIEEVSERSTNSRHWQHLIPSESLSKAWFLELRFTWRLILKLGWINKL